VLGDIVGPAADRLLIGAGARAALSRATGRDVAADDPPPGVTVADGIVSLERVHRFGGGIARLATAIRCGDADDALAVLADPPDEVTWIPVDDVLAPVRERAIAAARAVTEAARSGAAREALEALGAFRVLCAHRRGPYGVSAWNSRVESWMAIAVDDRSYPGRPLLVTENDYELGLYNGDTGVIVQVTEDRVGAAFERGGATVEFAPSRLSAVETVYAMTIHKSQGSQFDTAAVLLPPPSSRILTRELLYTAATRARKTLILAGSEESIRTAIARPVARASGLRRRLWGG
jgi:exodeoxyribonuclease V alpha subunit